MSRPPDRPADCPPLDTATPAPLSEPPRRAKRLPNAGSWKPGQSGNVKGGHPRPGLAFASAIRERLDPHKVLDLVCEYIDDKSVSTADKLGVLLPWMHAGYLQPPRATALTIDTTSSSPARDWAQLDVAAHRALLEQLRGVPLLEGGTTVDAYHKVWFEIDAYAREAAFVADGKRRWGSAA